MLQQHTVYSIILQNDRTSNEVGPWADHEGTREVTASRLFLTSTLRGVGRQHHAARALPNSSINNKNKYAPRHLIIRGMELNSSKHS